MTTPRKIVKVAPLQLGIRDTYEVTNPQNGKRLFFWFAQKVSSMAEFFRPILNKLEAKDVWEFPTNEPTIGLAVYSGERSTQIVLPFQLFKNVFFDKDVQKVLKETRQQVEMDFWAENDNPDLKALMAQNVQSYVVLHEHQKTGGALLALISADGFFEKANDRRFSGRDESRLPALTVKEFDPADHIWLKLIMLPQNLLEQCRGNLKDLSMADYTDFVKYALEINFDFFMNILGEKQLLDKKHQWEQIAQQ